MHKQPEPRARTLSHMCKVHVHTHHEERAFNKNLLPLCKCPAGKQPKPWANTHTSAL